MKLRRSRQLSAEERRLWAHVARAVKPLPGRSLPEAPAEPTPAAEAEPLPPPVAPSPRTPTLPPLAPMERKTLVALRRGSRRAEAVVDLHGMRQSEAHRALIDFLLRSREQRGHSIVLVITGKGAAAAGGGLFEERGVLRRVVPHWLRLPELRQVVLGFEEAAPQHGGAGALYVRLRRRRAAEP